METTSAFGSMVTEDCSLKGKHIFTDQMQGISLDSVYDSSSGFLQQISEKLFNKLI